MIPIALPEREHEHGVPSVTPNEQPSQNVSDLQPDTRGSEGQDIGDREDREMVADRPSVAAPEHTRWQSAWR